MKPCSHPAKWQALKGAASWRLCEKCGAWRAARNSGTPWLPPPPPGEFYPWERPKPTRRNVAAAGLVAVALSIVCLTAHAQELRAPVVAARPRRTATPAACLGFPFLGPCAPAMAGQLFCAQPWYPRLDRLDCYRCTGGCWWHVVPGVGGAPDATITPYATPTRAPTP